MKSECVKLAEALAPQKRASQNLKLKAASDVTNQKIMSVIKGKSYGKVSRASVSKDVNLKEVFVGGAGDIRQKIGSRAGENNQKTAVDMPTKHDTSKKPAEPAAPAMLSRKERSLALVPQLHSSALFDTTQVDLSSSAEKRRKSLASGTDVQRPQSPSTVTNLNRVAVNEIVVHVHYGLTFCVSKYSSFAHFVIQLASVLVLNEDEFIWYRTVDFKSWKAASDNASL